MRNINAVDTWLPAADRTAGVTSADQTNRDATGIMVYCNVNAVPGIQTLQVKLQGKDPLSGTYYDISSNLVAVATGLILLKVLNGITSVAAAVTGQSAADVLPYIWRLQTVHSGGGTWNYSVSYTLHNMG